MRLFWRPTEVSSVLLVLVAILAVGGFALVESHRVVRSLPHGKQKSEASLLTQKAYETIKQAREDRQIPIDETLDPAESGLIGVTVSTITSKAGQLPAKQTSINPNWGAVFVSLYRKAGLRRGDTIALGFSGSFPALNIAALAACKVMGLRPIIISSVSASMWGANHPQFTWLDMELELIKAGVFDKDWHSLYASMGGLSDQAIGLQKAAIPDILAAITRTIEPPIKLRRSQNDLPEKKSTTVDGEESDEPVLPAAPKACETDETCDKGFRCTHGLCRKKCKSRRGCPSGSTCKRGFCHQRCKKTVPCAEGLHCYKRHCVQCTESSHCSPGMICKDQRCGNCTGHEECGDTEFCGLGKCYNPDILTRTVTGTDLRDLVQERIDIYKAAAAGSPIRAYVNVGGGIASVGSLQSKKRFRPGVNTRSSLGKVRKNKAGVMHHFIRKGVPVIHVVRLRTMAKRYGLEWAPLSTPNPGTGGVYEAETYAIWLVWAVLIVILLALVAITRVDITFLFRRIFRSQEGDGPGAPGV
mgnify:CR=1 FL=1